MGIAGYWFFGDALLGIERDPSCRYDLDSGRILDKREDCAISLSAELSLLRHNMDQMRRKLCGSDEGECAFDPEGDAPAGESNELLNALNSLPINWAMPRLFPVDQELTVPSGQTVELSFPGGGSPSKVMVGTIILRSSPAKLVLQTKSEKTCENGDPDVPKYRYCTQSLSGDLRMTRLAISAAVPTRLSLICSTADCVLSLGNKTGSASLPSDSKCECKE